MSLLRKSTKDLPLSESKAQSVMVDDETLRLVVSSLPTFKVNSKKIAIEMYRRIFHFNASLKSLFSLEFLNSCSSSSTCPMAHHGLETQISAQAQILADSILNFCANVNNISAFEPVLARICAKHVSRQVQPEHYTVVAKCFSEAIREVIGEQVSKEELEAWDKAVVHLASLLIEREKTMYKSLETTPGAWLVSFAKISFHSAQLISPRLLSRFLLIALSHHIPCVAVFLQGFRAFQVSKMQDVQGTPSVSVVLEPQDKESLAEYISGQYVCIRAETGGFGTVHRNIALCPRINVDDGVNKNLSSYEIRLTVPAKPKDKNDCRVNTDAIIYEHMKNAGEVQLSPPVGGYVNRAGGGHNPKNVGGGFLRASAAAKSAGLGGSRVVALQGVRSPLAQVASNDLARGMAHPRINQFNPNGAKKPSPMERFQGLN